jgi:hypothetical protein
MGRFLIGVVIGIALTVYTDKKKAQREAEKASSTPTPEQE